jgi:hypothetical protein
LAGDVSGFVAGQEHDGGGDVAVEAETGSTFHAKLKRTSSDHRPNQKAVFAAAFYRTKDRTAPRQPTIRRREQ